MPSFRQFEHVAALADYRSFNRAATAVGLTQPAFSLSIQKLEEEYGTLLFERSKREITPTIAGTAVINAAKQALATVGNLRRELDLLCNVETARFIIGCDTLIAEAVLGPALSRLLERYSQLRFSIHVGAWDSLLEDLEAGRIDIYLGSAPDKRDDRFAMTDIELPRMIHVCRPGHPITNLPKVTHEDILTYPIAGPRVAPWYDGWLRARFSDQAVAKSQTISQHFIESDDYGVIRYLARNTDTITSAFPAVVEQDLQLGTLVQANLEGLDFHVPAVVGVPIGKSQPPVIRALIDEILAEFQPMQSRNAQIAGRNRQERD